MILFSNDPILGSRNYNYQVGFYKEPYYGIKNDYDVKSYKKWIYNGWIDRFYTTLTIISCIINNINAWQC